MPRIPVIDGLRGIAILAVIYHHTLSWRASFQAEGLLGVLASGGWHGVNLFFILSGFVLYLPYASGDRHIRGGSGALAFYGRRAFRLLPLYYFSTCVLLVFYLSWDIGNWSTYDLILRYLTVTTGFFHSSFYPPVNYVLWSLGVEIWFSVLFPGVLWAVRVLGWRTVLIVVLFLSASTRIFGQVLAEGPPRNALNLNFVSDSVVGRLDEFVLGMFAAHLYHRNCVRHFGAISLVSGLALTFMGMGLWQSWMGGSMPTWAAGLFNIPLDVGMTLCLLSLLVNAKGVARIVAAWPLQLMGMMCFSLYIWHGVAFLKLRPHVTDMGTYVVYLSLTLTISWFTYRYIEFRSVDDWRKLLPSRRGQIERSHLEPQPH